MPGAGPGEIGRLGRASAWISAAFCLPYLFLKVVWALDVPIGIRDRSELDSSGWMVGNALMGLLELAGLLLVLALVRPWARTAPAWLVLFPLWVGTGLLFEVIVGSALFALFSSAEATSERADVGAYDPWVFVLVYSSFAGQGAALAIAFGAHVRARWGWLLRQRTGAVLSLTRRRRVVAEVLAALLLVVVAACWYWAAGGTVGLSDDRPRPTWALAASGVVGATVAGAGLLALAGRWGRHTRLWLPVALAWLGSGAVAAFDGLNQLFLIAGLGGTDAHWSPIELVLVAKVAIGAVAAAVTVFAVATAARDTRTEPAAAVRDEREPIAAA